MKKERIKPLSTNLIVERVIKEGNLMTITELKRELPIKITNKTLKQILEYLEFKGKILTGSKGILWIYNTNTNLRNAIAKGRKL